MAENDKVQSEKSEKSETKDEPGTVVVHASTIEVTMKPAPEGSTKKE